MPKKNAVALRWCKGSKHFNIWLPDWPISGVAAKLCLKQTHRRRQNEPLNAIQGCWTDSRVKHSGVLLPCAGARADGVLIRIGATAAVALRWGKSMLA